MSKAETTGKTILASSVAHYDYCAIGGKSVTHPLGGIIPVALS